MITIYTIRAGRLAAHPLPEEPEAAAADLSAAIWIDMFDPTADEDALLKRVTGIDIPTREEMEEIETSSRLYVDDTAAFMTAMLPAGTDTDAPAILPVSFILAGSRIVTVRFHEPRAFASYTLRAARAPVGADDPLAIAAGLLDAVIDRLADILEQAGRDIEALSKEIFTNASTGPVRGRDFQSVLRSIGRRGDLLSMLRDSLATLERLFAFLANIAQQKKCDRDTRTRIKTLSRDAASLIDHASFLSQKITFLLDATLGMISIEQNAIIKIFSVAAVIFLPPTLVASVYGMNFARMPELNWAYGYPSALAMMGVSALVPYLYFKRKGWL